MGDEIRNYSEIGQFIFKYNTGNHENYTSKHDKY